MASDGWSVRDECEYRMRLLEPGYEARVLVDAGGPFYDPMMGWVEPDHSVILCDIGGQREPGWNPDEPHGAIYRLWPNGRVETIVPPEKILAGMPMAPRQAPPSFGKYAGDLFFPGQAKPGRAGALQPHKVFRLPQGTDTVVEFAEVPHAGRIGGGVPGGLTGNDFGTPGTGLDGYYVCHSLMNCTIYRVGPDAVAEPWVILDEPAVPHPIMPYQVFTAGPAFGAHAGSIMVAGLARSSFEEEAPADNQMQFWVIDDDGRVDPTPVADGDMGLAKAKVAPPEFGPFGGHTFLCDFGTVNLMHVSKPPPGPLPYDCRILRIDPVGETHVFADGLQGGWLELLFDGPRLLVGCLRRSYSTGEYHEPDGSIYEILATGTG